MKRILPFLIVLLAFACVLCACDDPGDGGPEAGTKPMGNSCTHNWEMSMDPQEDSEGSINCTLCHYGESFPALSDSRLTASEDGDATIYSFTTMDGSVATYRFEHFVFEACEGGYNLIEYRGNKAAVVIPSTYNGQTVVSVGRNDSFPIFDSASITSVTFPDSISEIEGYLFSTNCTALTGLYLPATGDDLTIRGLFMGQNIPVKTVTVTSGTTLGFYFFAECQSLETVYLPSTVRSIGYDAFGQCDSLDVVYFDCTLAEYCEILFDNNWYSASHPMYNADTFYFKDENGEYVTVGDVLVIPEGVTSISAKAFMHMPMHTLVLPDSVTVIGEEAFQYCENLTAVVLGTGLQSVGKNAFYQSSSLETVYYKGDYSGWRYVQIDNSDSPSNYYLLHAETYYYQEEGDVFDYARGEVRWHFDENGLPVLWSFDLTNTVDGKTFVHAGTEVEISDEYWYMLEAAEAQGMLEYVLEGEQLFFYQNSETKEEFEEKVQNAMNEDYTALSISFAEGRFTGIDTYPASYIELEGDKIYRVSNETLVFTIENGNLVWDNSNEYITVITTLTLSE